MLLLALLATACAFYLPGVAPIEFSPGDPVELKVNKLTSTKTQLPYRYYSLPYCRPNPIKNTAENLGEILRGDVIENSLYEIQMKVEPVCKVLCSRSYTEHETKQFINKIKDEYRVQWIVDNLPAATAMFMEGGDMKYYQLGFLVGTAVVEEHAKEKSYYLNNHVTIKLMYHDTPNIDTEGNPTARIVGFELVAKSIEHRYAAPDHAIPVTCNPAQGATVPWQKLHGPTNVTFTYDVVWEASDVEWASRWDTYLLVTDAQIHWFSIINSLLIVMFLTGMIAMIMMRTLHHDLARYNRPETLEEQQEETGWKLVHGDVFRPPVMPMLLAVSLGSGMQVISMVIVTLFFAILGFLSPANRGGLLSVMVLMYVFMGSVAGYTTARAYKMFGFTSWKRMMLMSAMFYPGIVFFIFFFLNFFIWGAGSSSAVPFGTLVALLFLWFGVSTPLVYAGGFLGIRAEAIQAPVRTNQIPREIPTQVWYMSGPACVLMGGVLPFGAIFIELYFILSSIWLNQLYYVFGFLFLVMLILCVTCAEIAVVMTYFQLCAEDYQWWWRAFLTPGVCGLYVFLYSLFYYFAKLELNEGVPTLLYFGYTVIICLVLYLITGSIGLLSTFWFVHKIYASVKID
eukprot:TRINITY_DN15117_c0_g1_i1.p1 TRINITY_DN15117_c0_g1~~TRINITY_DN15117_c0_g1_i1.p1  ORF type:complete len:625 (-),score=159.52 TRINITY_DN15117_c0_g1_i1:31-1905(-)